LNAKLELIKHIEDRDVKYVSIRLDPHCRTGVIIEGSLDDVLDKLDFDYYNGYGGQELYGYIWYADGTWSSRQEYGGSEWWEHNVCPELPESYKKAGHE